MAQHRNDVLDGLKTLISDVSGVTTVVRTYGDIDIAQYSSTDLPLVSIKEPEEDTYEELTSRRSMMLLVTKLVVWFVDWNLDIKSTYETLMKNIRDKIGSDFTISGNAVEVRVNSITEIDGNLPVWNFGLELELKYYIDEQHT